MDRRVGLFLVSGFTAIAEAISATRLVYSGYLLVEASSLLVTACASIVLLLAILALVSSIARKGKKPSYLMHLGVWISAALAAYLFVAEMFPDLVSTANTILTTVIALSVGIVCIGTAVAQRSKKIICFIYFGGWLSAVLMVHLLATWVFLSPMINSILVCALLGVLVAKALLIRIVDKNGAALRLYQSSC